MKKIIKILLVLIVAAIVSAGVFSVYTYYKIISPYIDDTTPFELVVNKGEGVNEVSARLERNSIIADNFYFDMYIWLIRSEEKIKAGAYIVSPSMSPKDIVHLLIDGDMTDEDKITILEGWTNREIADAYAEFKLEKDGSKSKDAYAKSYLDETKKVSKYQAEFEFLKDLPDGVDLEGYLFPDTYRIYTNSEPEDLIRKQLTNFENKVYDKLSPDFENYGKPFFEILTLASIVEKEVMTLEEMKMVAGVYYNRIEIGMRLQSDVTITYLTGKKDPQPTYEDTRTPSPYNTYLNDGLPPGPVSNPGLQAIMATIEPTDHNYFFFLTKLDTGEAVFAKDAEGHNENKAMYLDNIKY